MHLEATWDARLVYRGARAEARRLVARKAYLLAWYQDLVQEIVTAAWISIEAGYRLSRRVWRYCGVRATRALFGDIKNCGRYLRETARHIQYDETWMGQHDGSPARLCVALATLQQVWPYLSIIERAGLSWRLTGTSIHDAAAGIEATTDAVKKAAYRAEGMLRDGGHIERRAKQLGLLEPPRVKGPRYGTCPICDAYFSFSTTTTRIYCGPECRRVAERMAADAADARDG